MKLLGNWKSIGVSLGYAMLIFATGAKVLAECAHTYASAQEDGPPNSCSEQNNTPSGNSIDSCEYLVSGNIPIFCRDTTAETECYQYINPLTGQPQVQPSVTVWTYTGWCVNGTCNYNTSIGGTNPQVWTDMPWRSDRACPEG